ncbi:hypothetical protein CBR_g30644 [Chara braunii]|uniref:Reverse transcriptase domain-containing protein n=1 Tax=Chara braunii TaxID=69332 RepID=A0A388LDC4_CHABU|nr:hypothetical protein CBR_g30644 [Chara braunii]|eukprot:GBG80277.1 hypothetical protein CBR_g30644 [Chara braunii]
MAQLRDYLHTAVPAPLMDAGAEVVDLLAYIAKIDRKFKTQRYDDIDAPLLYIRIQIREATCSALIDCGASHNYISQDFMAKYKANRDRCEFARQELEYLGHYVTPQGIRPLADKIEALRVWPEPINTTDIRSFMGLADYYQRFITGYSRIAAPMTRLQSPKVPFVFDDDARQSFQALKTAMLMAPVLSTYDPTLPTRVTTNTSGYGIGAVLEQHDGDDWHPVEYFSHKVPPINSLDDARKKELLAFGMALKQLRHFLLGRRVVEREVVHAIEIIPGSSIPRGRIYRMSPGELDELRRQLKELVEKGWIRPSVSPYGCPVLFVPKKEGTLRMCIDYRGLNAITVKNREPLPRIDDLLDRVQGCRYFNKIDLKSGYHQIAIWPEDQHKTAFQTRYGLYEFVVMPFGLCNAPSIFQHAMNWIFHDYLDKFVVVYLDDILILSKTVEEHVAHLDKVLSLLRQHKFKINGEKCEFGRTRILYLGHEISAEGLKPDDAKVASIRDWPRPQSVTVMRSFLGMTGYYRTFVKNYSIVAAPLTDLTRLDTPWEWTDECEAAFRHLKHALTHYEVLKLPDPDKPYLVTTDASQYGIGAVLAQQEGRKLRAVEYMSKKMPSRRLAKSTYEKELYAVYTHWRHYLLGRFFILRTDHQTLRWMRTQSVLSEALKRIEVIEQYDLDPQYLKGEYNKVADALSRRLEFSGALITEFDLMDDVTQSLVEAYRQDQFMSEIIRRLEAKDKKTSAKFELVNGLLFLEKAGNKRLCVPNCESLRSLFLGECHDATGQDHSQLAAAVLVAHDDERCTAVRGNLSSMPKRQAPYSGSSWAAQAPSDSRKARQSFTHHLLRLMTSWAVVCDVWYLEPQNMQPGETAVHFAERVQKLIAKRAGIKPVPWDGYLKYYRPSPKFTEKKQAKYADAIIQRLEKPRKTAALPSVGMKLMPASPRQSTARTSEEGASPKEGSLQSKGEVGKAEDGETHGPTAASDNGYHGEEPPKEDVQERHAVPDDGRSPYDVSAVDK